MAKSVYQILIELEGDKNLKSSLEDIGKTVGLTGAALSAFSAGAAKLAADYEKTLGDVAIVIDEQTGTAQELSDSLFDLQDATDGIINVQEGAVASAELLSSGIKGQTTILNALESSQKAAIAGQSDLNTISSAAAGVVNSYGDALGKGLTQGQKFNKVVDLILQTQIDGVITADQYARSIGQIASLANNAGISLEELNGSIALSTEKGTPASVAFTNLKSAISNITAPTAMAKEEAKELGIEFDAARLKSVGLQQVIADIFASENFDEASLGKLFGSTEAQSIITQLGSDLDTLTEKVENQKNGVGALDEAYQKVDETVNQRVTNSLNLLQGALTKIGQGVLIAFEPVLSLVAKLASALAELPTPVLATVGALVGLSGVTLTVGGAALVLAANLGAIKATLTTGLPILISFVKGLSGLAASALSGSLGLKSFNLSALTTNVQLNLMSLNAKKALVAMGPLIKAAGLFGGAAASIALVVDTLNKIDTAAKANRESLGTLEEKLLEIRKASEGTTPEIVEEASLQATERLNQELGFVQRNLDRFRNIIPGLSTSLEAATSKSSISFAELNQKVNEVEDSTRNLIGIDNSAAGLSPEVISETTQAIDASIEALTNSVVVTEADILSRDGQIARLEAYKETLNATTEETKENTGATETQTQTVEEAAKAYEDYKKRVEASIKNTQNATQNAIDSLVGSESRRVQDTIRLQEESVNSQVALLEDLKNQSQTTAQERVEIEIEIQTKKTQLNKDRVEANKKLEELYNQFLRDSINQSRVEFENAQLSLNQTVEESYDERKRFILDAFELEKGILQDRLAEVEKGSAEEKALTLEVAELELSKTQEIRALNEEVTAERLNQIQALKEAETSRLDLLNQSLEIQGMMLTNSNNVLNSQASILGKISGLLEGDNASLEQRAALVGLVGEIVGKNLADENQALDVGMAKFTIEQELANIEVRKLDLKIKQLEIDKETLRIANEIKQLEIQSERDQIAEQLRSSNLNSQERANLQRRDAALSQQSSLENQKTNLNREAIDSQLEFTNFEKRLSEILREGFRSRGNGADTSNSTVGEIKERALANNSISEAGEARYNGLITREEWQDIFDSLEEKRNKEAEDQKKELAKSTKANEETSANTSTLSATQDQTNTQIAGNTEEIRNVSGSIGNLVGISQSQLELQRRMSARLDQISRQLDTLPGNIASRLPRPSQPVNSRR